MNISSAEDQIRVFCRIAGDDNAHEYPRCVGTLTRTSIALVELRETSKIEGFLKKDRIKNSPNSSTSDLSAFAPPTQEPKIYKFTFDYIFHESDTLESIFSHLSLDLSFNHTLVNIGKTDLFTHTTGLILRTIKTALDLNFSIEFGCAAISSGRMQSLTENYKILKDFSASINYLSTLEYFNPRRCKEEVYITTLVLRSENSKICVQFADVHQFGGCLDAFGKVMTNDIFSRDGSAQAKDSLVQALTKSICFGSRVVLFGNIQPTAPFLIQNRSILYYIENIQQNRHRNRNAYTELLLREVRKLQKSNIKCSNKSVELSTQMLLLKDQLETQNSQLLEARNGKGVEEVDNSEGNELRSLQECIQRHHIEIERLRKENNELIARAAEKAESYKELQEKFEAVHARYVGVEKNNTLLIEKIERLEHSANYSWTHVQKIEDELRAAKALIKEYEEKAVNYKVEPVVVHNEGAQKHIQITKDVGEVSDIHMEFFEQIVVLNRNFNTVINVYKNEMERMKIEADLLYWQSKYNERFLFEEAQKLEDYYESKMKTIDFDSKSELEKTLILLATKNRECSTMSGELEETKDRCKSLEAELEKIGEDHKMEIHNFKKKVKHNLRTGYSELTRKNEELSEQVKKLNSEKKQITTEKNQILAAELEKESRYEFLMLQLREEKEKEIKKLTEQIDLLKVLREPRSKKGK